MTLTSILVMAIILIVIGVLLGVVNRYANTKFPMHPTILHILNLSVIVFTVIFVLLWFLQAFGLLGVVRDLRIQVP